MSIFDFLNENPDILPENSLFFIRTGYIIKQLTTIQEMGYRVINTPESLTLTTDKYNLGVKLIEEGVNNPDTWLGYKGKNKDLMNETIDHIIKLFDNGYEELIIKPSSSLSSCRGKWVHLIKKTYDRDEITKYLNKIPDGFPTNYKDGTRLCIQSFVPYMAMHRIVVINGKAIKMSWMDRITKQTIHSTQEWNFPMHLVDETADYSQGSLGWKVSCCLNLDVIFNPDPDVELLSIAEKSQKAVGGEVNFIDVFETKNSYVICEMNTSPPIIFPQNLAKQHHHPQWNFSSNIAKYLYSVGDKL